MLPHPEEHLDSVSAPGLLLGATRAPAPRTLVDVLQDSARRFPDASALDDGAGALSYRELLASATAIAARLQADGVGPGDRVGIRIASGSRDLYLAILGVLIAGAAYVPVDADDPEERARLVFGEAKVCGTILDGGRFAPTPTASSDADADPQDPTSITLRRPTPDDDAWIIFTSGSTGTPKGVAVSHRSAAAFVDAESRVFLQDEPLGPDDRVLAGLSVAFDASCEEMWLAWGHGACLVPAPRALVRSGMDLGPWLVARGISVVSTVPTLAAMWPPETLDNVRLLIFGGEACPPELAARLAEPGREVWNTYGPTEATVVACAAPLDGSLPVRIGLPLDGWDLAVVDPDGSPVADGEVGELVIGGVGLARYLDPAKDAEKYAPMPSLGWNRAYRSGDLVRFDRAGLIFQGRVDDQVKIGGRRVELGEIESALQALTGVSAAAVVVQRTEAGNAALVGYLAVPDRDAFDTHEALEGLRAELPAALVPLLAVLDELPVRVSGKVDKAALPWPLESDDADLADLPVTEAWLAQQWTAVLGTPVAGVDANFFDLGGSSLAAAQLVSRIRLADPGFTVAEIYAHPRLGAMAAVLTARGIVVDGPDGQGDGATGSDGSDITGDATRTPLGSQWLQTLLGVPLFILAGARWLTIAAIAATILRSTGFKFLPEIDWWWILVGVLVFLTPLGRMGISVALCRALLHGLRPGDYPRGGSVHLRVWFAEQVSAQVGAVGLAGAPWISYYARALGATIGAGVDLHALPPVTGMLTVGARSSIEPEVDLSGYWIDGDTLRLGAIRIGAGSTVGARSTLLPGTKIGKNAEIAPGSAVFGRVPAGQLWSGSPAVRIGKAKHGWPEDRPPSATRWLWAYGAAGVVLSLLPYAAYSVGALYLWAMLGAPQDFETLVGRAFWNLPVAALIAFAVLALCTLVLARLLGLGLRTGYHPVRSRIGWQVWAGERLLDAARTQLFPLYASLFTPVWLRLLGAKVGSNVEASTVLLLPAMTTVGDGAFLADDTMVASYELGGGWMHVDEAVIGKRAFLGNSGMTSPGRTIPKDGLVAVLSATPRKAKAGSSWMGSPPVRMRRRVEEHDDSRTFNPPLRLKFARGLWEVSRLTAVIVTTAIGLAVILALIFLVDIVGLGLATALSGVVLLIAGAVAAAIGTAVKWLLVGRIRAGEHPLWSSFIWRNEVSDTFIEMVAAPWFASAATGTPALVWWLRSLGARIGAGVWCETYWLPEADLVRLGRGSTVNRGCVVQTHLFHDRMMSMDTVALSPAATLGPHSVILPAASIEAAATVGPASLVMRGESVPARSRFSGNPIGPWRDVTVAEYRDSVTA